MRSINPHNDISERKKHKKDVSVLRAMEDVKPSKLDEFGKYRLSQSKRKFSR